MAVETTPLGFKKPDGNDPLRNGNDIISANAQRAQELLTSALIRLGVALRERSVPGLSLTASRPALPSPGT